MRKLFLIAAFLVACCGGPQKAPAPPPVEDDPRAVLITTKCPDDSVWQGTGYQVDTETVITAAHVVMCGKRDVEPKILQLGRVDVTANYKDVFPDYDVAFIHYQADVEPILPAAVTPGEQVCWFPAVPERGKKCGYVFDVQPGYAGIVLLGPVVPGNSGSLLINSKGEGVGVVTSYDHLFGYATPVMTE